MAYIQSHQTLLGHPKTKRLVRALGISRACAVGHLHMLWWWALDFAPDADLSRFADLEIADAAEWEGDATAFVGALLAAGFLDADRRIHDWDDYTGRLLDSRRSNADRQRRWRDKRRALREGDATTPDPETGSNGYVTVTSNDVSPLRNGAREEKTSVDKTNQDKTSAAHPARTVIALVTGAITDEDARARESWLDDRWGEFVGAYPGRKKFPDELRDTWPEHCVNAPAFERIMAGLAAWSATDGWTEQGGRFAKSPRDFLHERIYDDAPPRPAAVGRRGRIDQMAEVEAAKESIRARHGVSKLMAPADAIDAQFKVAGARHGR